MKRKIKKMQDGRAMVNLGCGATMHPEWNNVDSSIIGKLRKNLWLAKPLHSIGIISNSRWDRLHQIAPDIIIHNLKKGIPFVDESADVVYLSHVFEHIDRKFVPGFLKECLRVLQPGGTIRVVIPDLEIITKRYCKAIEDIDQGVDEARSIHSKSTADIFEQMVNMHLEVTLSQKPVVRWIETRVRGNTLKSGDAHRWMYDRHSLAEALKKAGFTQPTQHQPETSRIQGWEKFYLDTEIDGSVYKPDSLYMEAIKNHS